MGVIHSEIEAIAQTLATPALNLPALCILQGVNEFYNKIMHVMFSIETCSSQMCLSKV